MGDLGNCNTLNDLSNKVCVPNKREDINIHVLNVIAEKNESKILKKDIPCECKCKFDGRKCNSYLRWNGNKFQCECKKHKICEKKTIFRILLHVVAYIYIIIFCKYYG